METIIIFSLTLALVLGIGFMLYFLTPTISLMPQKIRHARVRNSEPRIRRKAHEDWKQLNKQIKKIHLQAKPATIHATVRQNLHMEEMGDSLKNETSA